MTTPPPQQACELDPVEDHPSTHTGHNAERHLRVVPPDAHDPAPMPALAPAPHETPLNSRTSTSKRSTRPVTRSTPREAQKPAERAAQFQTLGNGIRRDHATTCLRAGRCDCPYSFWLPTENGRRRRARVFGTLADARRAKTQAEGDARKRRREQANRASGVTPMPTLTTWYEHLCQHEWTQTRIGTQERRAITFDRRLREDLGSLRVDQFTPQLVEAWLYERIRTEGNRRCVQHAHQLLAQMLNAAMRHRLVAYNAAAAIPYPEKGIARRELRTLTMDEYQRLLAACTTRAQRTMVRVLCEGGLRVSELVALQVGDLNLREGTITVQRRVYRTKAGTNDIDTPKGRKVRVVALADSLTNELRWHLADTGHPAASEPVWTRRTIATGGTEQPRSRQSVDRMLRTISIAAGLGTLTNYVTAHALRRSGATIAVAAGVSPLIAQRQLGHSRLEMTERHYLGTVGVGALKAYGQAFE